MRIYTLHNKQNLPITVDEAWEFLSSPKNIKIFFQKETLGEASIEEIKINSLNTFFLKRKLRNYSSLKLSAGST